MASIHVSARFLPFMHSTFFYVLLVNPCNRHLSICNSKRREKNSIFYSKEKGLTLPHCVRCRRNVTKSSAKERKKAKKSWNSFVSDRFWRTKNGENESMTSQSGMRGFFAFHTSVFPDHFALAASPLLAIPPNLGECPRSRFDGPPNFLSIFWSGPIWLESRQLLENGEEIIWEKRRQSSK